MIVYYLICEVIEKVSKYFDLLDCSDYLQTKCNFLSSVPIYHDTSTFMPVRRGNALDPQFEERYLASRARVRCLSEKYVVWRCNW